MAETAVGIVIDKLIPLLIDEVTLFKGVHGQVKSVKDQLLLIQAYLKDADVKAEMADTSHLVKEWVKQVREVTFRIEDVIDVYMLKMAKRPQTYGVVGVISQISFLIRSVIPRHKITSDIVDIRGTLRRLNEERETFAFNSYALEASSDHAGMSRHHDLRMGAHFVKDDELVGIEDTRKVLTNWLEIGERRRPVISLVGEGGLGKTTIVKNVYNEQRKKKSFACYAWITVSRLLKGEHLLKMILQSFYEQDGNKLAAMEISQTILDKESWIMKLREYLQGKSYMIVFDDVWEIDFWVGVEFALPDDNINRIIITTRDKGVAEFCQRSAPVYVHELEPLHPKDALKLFLLKAFQFDKEGCPEELIGLSQDFVRKCEGVPLAIVAISGLLSTKKKSISEWHKVYDSLRSKFSSDPHLRSFYQVLSESYRDLPYHLKLCLLHFGLFPEDYSISRARLIRLWVAEGFVKESDNKHQTLEEVAEEYLGELIRRNLVKVSEVYPYGRLSSCRVHDLMHDFILRKGEELNFFQVIKNQESKVQPWIRRLSIHGNKEDDGIVNTRNYGSVRSCFVFDMEQLSELMVKSLFSSFKLLVALDFEDSPLADLPRAIGNLLNLKYLNLRKTKIKSIPKFIGKLINLETLNLRDTQVLELPQEINRLLKLRHLLSYPSQFFVESERVEGLKLNEGIGCLTALQSLTKVDVSDKDGIIIEMKNFKKMRRLGITKVRSHNGNHICNAVKNMTYLCSLLIEATEEHEVLELQSLVNPPPNLERLYIRGRLERLPEWIPKLKNLVVLSLDWAGLAQDPLPILNCLPGLLSLCLFKSYEGDELHFREGWFPKLKFLRLRNLPGLMTLKIDQRGLPQLEDLVLGPYPKMVEMPTGIQNLESLKTIFLYQMPPKIEEAIETLCEDASISLYVR